MAATGVESSSIKEVSITGVMGDEKVAERILKTVLIENMCVEFIIMKAEENIKEVIGEQSVLDIILLT